MCLCVKETMKGKRKACISLPPQATSFSFYSLRLDTWPELPEVLSPLFHDESSAPPFWYIQWQVASVPPLQLSSEVSISLFLLPFPK